MHGIGSIWRVSAWVSLQELSTNLVDLLFEMFQKHTMSFSPHAHRSQTCKVIPRSMRWYIVKHEDVFFCVFFSRSLPEATPDQCRVVS